MSDAAFSDLEEMTIGASARLSAGPFLDADKVALNFTVGNWTFVVHLKPTCGDERVGTGTFVGDASGNLVYDAASGEIDSVDQWLARFEVTDDDNSRKYFSVLGRFNVLPVFPTT